MKPEIDIFQKIGSKGKLQQKKKIFPLLLYVKKTKITQYKNTY